MVTNPLWVETNKVKKMYSYNYDVSFGFIIISPEHNIGRLKSTINSIRTRFRDKDIICVTSEDSSQEDIDEIKKLCNVFKGGGTYTSLINTGMQNGNPEWNIIVIEGSVVPYNIDEKFFQFMENEKDIFFPIVIDYNHQGRPVNLYADFTQCTLNGLTINRKTFIDIGNMSDDSLDESKIIWAIDAIDKGCKFKAILGAKIC